MNCKENIQSGKNFSVELKRHDSLGNLFIGYKRETIEQITSGMFLEELVGALSKTIKNTYVENNEHPAFRSETSEKKMKKMHSEIKKTLGQLQWNHKHEWPIERKNKKSRKGNLDFIIRKNEKDDYVYAVEVKVCHKGYCESGPLSEKKIGKFIKAIQQIKNTYITEPPAFCKGAKTVIGIALLFIVFTSKAKSEFCTDIPHLNKVKEKIKHHMVSIDTGATETQKTYLKNYIFEARWFLASDIVTGKSHKGKSQGEPKMFPALCAIAQIFKMEKR